MDSANPNICNDYSVVDDRLNNITRGVSISGTYVDPETGEIIPTDGRCKKLSPAHQDDSSYQMPKTLKECKEEIRRLLEENESLKKQLAELQK